MKKLLIFLVLIGCGKEPLRVPAEQFPVSQQTLDKEISTSFENSEYVVQQPYVVLISLDGYRSDYTTKYGAIHLAEFETHAKAMVPSFPSKTFPNHYAIVTGLYPGHNGLLSNSFYDRDKNQVYSIGDRSKVEDASWYFGTPLWVLAGKQDMVTASMFWVGSEAPVQGMYPTYYFKYDGSIPHTDRVNKVMQWLMLPEKSRPHFITLYFSIIDSIGHQFGPESDELSNAVKEIDRTIGDLMKKIEATNLPVNVIVVSDHGMLEIAQEKMINMSEYIDLDKNMVTINIPTMVYSENETDVDDAYNKLVKDERLTVYKKDNLPEKYHYSIPSRTGDLVIIPKPPYVISSRSTIPAPGSSSHGWDPEETPEMGAIFYADGPNIKSGLEIEPFENIHVYPFIVDILGLEYDPQSIDGNAEVLEKVIEK